MDTDSARVQLCIVTEEMRLFPHSNMGHLLVFIRVFLYFQNLRVSLKKLHGCFRALCI